MFMDQYMQGVDVDDDDDDLQDFQDTNGGRDMTGV